MYEKSTPCDVAHPLKSASQASASAKRLEYFNCVISRVVFLGRTAWKNLQNMIYIVLMFYDAVFFVSGEASSQCRLGRTVHEMSHQWSRVESSRACTPKKWRAPLGTGVKKK